MPYKDPIKQKAAQHKSYVKDKDLYAERTRIRRIINKEYVYSLKSSSCCMICGEKDPRCLDLHHINPQEKDDSISRGIREWSLERLKKEIEKCQILCANCHKKHHKVIEHKKSIPTYREITTQYKLEHPCSCGESDPICLNFVFRNKEEKQIGISRITKIEFVLGEINKCDIICANCHRKQLKNCT